MSRCGYELRFYGARVVKAYVEGRSEREVGGYFEAVGLQPVVVALRVGYAPCHCRASVVPVSVLLRGIGL